MSTKYKVSKLGLGLKIDTLVLNEIQVLSEQFYPKEIGGVLVGKYCQDSKMAIVKHIIIPQQVVNGPYFFERKIRWINKELKRFYKESDGGLIYIGEWHSHPNCEAIPSQTDLEAIQNISKDKGVKVNAPILLIAHVSQGLFYIKPYIFFDEVLYNYK